MTLHSVDWAFVIGFFILSLAVGVAVTKRAGRSSSEFFLSGRNMPWWLLGVSMVATTFSSDTPNLVTDIVRQNGVAGNWVWWAFLLTGMLTVFVYAKLWRRSGVLTDLEFYEMRYSGKAAAFLRGFRAVYLGVFFNILIMASVSLAAIKIGEVMLNLKPVQTLLIASLVTVIYSMLGGLRGILITDFFQFIIAMIGSVIAAVVVLGLPEVGGMNGILTSEAIGSKINLLPDFSNTEMVISLLILPLAVQWWSVWYPGAEPGGGGYISQRMLSAKNEKHAIGATFLFNTAFYALRPWPWIIVALGSLLVFPSLESLQIAFPHIDPSAIRHDHAYAAMLTFLPRGLLGLVVASLIAAYMSTISTHLNWGSSYVVNDIFKRFVRQDASERQQVLVGRISTVLLMILACFIALLLSNALQAFRILLQIGAGTGLLFILRWFWWRINPFSEITAMVVSFIVAIYFQFVHPALGFEEISSHFQLLAGVGITTFAWIGVTLITVPSDAQTLRAFYRKVGPGGPGWKRVIEQAKRDNDPIDEAARKWDVPLGILCMVFGCLAVYGTLFATGYWIYGNYFPAIALTAIAVIASALLVKSWGKLRVGS
ncbi:MAG: Na+:solute symporter [candidate division Zixibacteria bacterium]|nr:Na+:solute symporter [candidate division Zixibacteria bacterium]